MIRAFSTSCAVWLAICSPVRYRVLVSTDLGGDPDDIQSLYRLVHYSDILRVEGIVSSPGPGARHSAEKIRFWIRQIDVERMRRNGHPELMPEAALLELVKQGAWHPGPPADGRTTEGSDWIVRRALAPDPEARHRPLWILVWGSATDVAQALYDEPRIASRIRIFSIGSNNTRNDPASRDFIFEGLKDRWPNLFWIESGAPPLLSRDTFRGVYLGGDQTGEWHFAEFVHRIIRPSGAPGAAFPLAGPPPGGLKEGDSPSMLYLLAPALGGPGNVDDPTSESWGGRYRHYDRSRFPHYYVDLETAEEARASISKWRTHFLSHWKKRWLWYGVTPNSENEAKR